MGPGERLSAEPPGELTTGVPDRTDHRPTGRTCLETDEGPVTEDKSPPSAKRRAGSVKEAIGKITGDVRVEAEGARQKRAARPKAGGSGPPDPDRR